jgi:ribonuclease-3
LKPSRLNIFSFFSNISSFRKSNKQLRHVLGFAPSLRGAYLYHQAFRHTSASENKSIKLVENISNERLEFLGDAVLDTIVADMLFRKFALKGEGFLTEMRSKIVSRDQLNNLAEKMGLVELLQFDKALDLQFHIRKSLAGNALESLIGAIYLDKGFVKTRKFILKKIVKPYLDMDELEAKNENYKSILYQYIQRVKTDLVFEMVHEDGKSHQKSFTIAVIMEGKEISRATNFTKKKAEQLAAMKACEIFGILEN